MSLIGKIKNYISSVGCYIRKEQTTCRCTEPDIECIKRYIDPQTNMWKYYIKCNYCGKTHYGN